MVQVPQEVTNVPVVGLLVAISVTWEDTVGGGSSLGGRREGREEHLRRSAGCEIEKNWPKYYWAAEFQQVVQGYATGTLVQVRYIAYVQISSYLRV